MILYNTFDGTANTAIPKTKFQCTSPTYIRYIDTIFQLIISIWRPDKIIELIKKIQFLTGWSNGVL